MNPILRFDFSSESIREALCRLGMSEEDDGKAIGARAWPRRRAWGGLTAMLRRRAVAALPAEDEAEISSLLDSAEERADAYLSGVETGPREPFTERMLADLERVEHLICARREDGFAALPYFPRWFFLHLTALLWTATTEERLARVKVAGIKVWNAGLGYLLRAAGDAARARARQIVVVSTEIHPTHHVVFDERRRVPLSHPLSCDLWEAEESARYLRAKHARAAVTDGGFTEIVHAIKAIIGGVKVREGSDIDDLKDPQQLLGGLLQGLALEEDLAREAALPSPITAAPRMTDDAALNLIFTLINSIIGELPIPGMGVVSTVTGLFIQWLFPTTTDEWAKIRQEFDDKLARQIAAFETHQIANKVKSAAEELDRFMKDFNKAPVAPGAPMPSGLASRLDTSISLILQVKNDIMNPFSGAMSSISHFENWFTTLTMAYALSARNPTTVDVDRDLSDIFAEVNSYFSRVDADCYAMQQNNTRTEISDSCCDNHVWTTHWNRRAQTQTVAGKYAYQNTSSVNYTMERYAKAFVIERAHLINYARVAAQQVIQNTTNIMNALKPRGWDGRTPKSIYENDLLPKNYARRDAAWRNWQTFCNQLAWQSKPSAGDGLDPTLRAQNDPISAYRAPSTLPKTIIDP